MTDKIIISRKEIEALQLWQDDEEIANNCYEDDDGCFILYDDLRALLDKAEVSEPVAKIVYDRKADENGFIYHKSRPQICSLIRDEKLLNYEHNTKLYTSPPNQSAKIAELEAEIARLNAIT